MERVAINTRVKVKRPATTGRRERRDYVSGDDRREKK